MIRLSRGYDRLSVAEVCRYFCILPSRTKFKMGGHREGWGTRQTRLEGRNGMLQRSRSPGSCLIELSRSGAASYVISGSVNFVLPETLWRSCTIQCPSPNETNHLEMNEATLCGSCRSCWFVTVHDRSIYRRERSR